eukprot:12705238-Alexandrium_andersonii.AAC.1
MLNHRPPGTTARIHRTQAPLFRGGPSPLTGRRQRSLGIPHGARCCTGLCPGGTSSHAWRATSSPSCGS